jgi:hypothetical protein
MQGAGDRETGVRIAAGKIDRQQEGRRQERRRERTDDRREIQTTSRRQTPGDRQQEDG